MLLAESSIKVELGESMLIDLDELWGLEFPLVVMEVLADVFTSNPALSKAVLYLIVGLSGGNGELNMVMLMCVFVLSVKYREYVLIF